MVGENHGVESSGSGKEEIVSGSSPFDSLPERSWFGFLPPRETIVEIFGILRNFNVRVLYVLLLLSFGGIFYMGARTSPIILFVFVVFIISFMLSVYLTKWVLTKDERPPEMVQRSDATRDGAEGFFRTQYGTISKMAFLLAFVILCIYLFRNLTILYSTFYVWLDEGY